ncbi:MAG: flagellar basal body protein [Lachnospiraceae bacterium]|nr:flagellar basal body protein [Lachnospiraceae bacterium]
MPLMASLWTGNSGLITSSNALNTTAHNMSNIDTEGYTRQQVQMGTRHYNMINKMGSAVAPQQVGLGVEYTSCRQVRSVFLDQSYRVESGRAQFYNVSYDCLVEVEDLLQEMNGAEFADSLNNLWGAIQDLNRDPANTVNMNTLMSRASEFVNRAQQVYTGLTNYQDNMNKTVAGYVKTINEYGDRISELNKQIVQVESGGREHANDLRDERNLLLDKLASLGRIDYNEDIFGNVSVYFEDVPFVLTDHVNHMGVEQGEGAKGGSSDGFATPYWEFMAVRQFDPDMNAGRGGYHLLDISNAKVYDLSREISSVAGTDVGKLRSVLLARGDHYATYHDITIGKETLADGYVMTGAEAQAHAETVHNFYNDNISKSVIMNVEAEFDQLVHNIVEQINSVFENAASNPARKNPELYVPGYEGYVNILNDPSATAAQKAAAQSDLNDAIEEASKKFDLFRTITDDEKGVVRYDIGEYDSIGRFHGFGPTANDNNAVLTDADGNDHPMMIRIGTTVTNLQINQDLLRNPSLFSMRDIEGNEDQKMTEALKNVFKDENYNINPNVALKTNLLEYYNSLVAQVANSGSVYDSLTDQQTLTVNAIRDAREQIVGTSSDEELEFMIKFQNAYNAASRYINVVSEMLEHLVNSLGS